ncbi:hypothetical protein PsorP6_014297 [Peronosclerospora sorghi]|uniref:Uncharacterized protein n=1 Tax=Peronosclerospora sorghi TaxID=230839 RepID=A0ACC0VFY4_9STRA|nr:hypothetical protein PsorP6_014297 [Peronosclerospora sorghi]
MDRSLRRYYDDEAETSAHYYPPSNLGPASFEQGASRKPSKHMQRVMATVCAVTLHGNFNDDSNTSKSGKRATSHSSSTLPASCAPVAARDRTVAFWQSEVAGCDTVPDGVTHLVFGFALVADGVIVPTFQSFDDTMKQCVEKLHKRCIMALASVGGSTNNDNMTMVTNATRFGESAATLVTKFGFDGIDLDDETVGVQFSADRTIGLLKATRTALDAAGETSALLTYDAYFYEGDPSVCAAQYAAGYSRCFPVQVLKYVDWVNIMAYNVNKDNTTAAAIYAAAVNTTFAAWRTQLGGDFSLATIGVCIDGGCAYGPGPSATVIDQWNHFARQDGYGGMMLYAASSEVKDQFPATRSIISAKSE